MVNARSVWKIALVTGTALVAVAALSVVDLPGFSYDTPSVAYAADHESGGRGRGAGGHDDQTAEVEEDHGSGKKGPGAGAGGTGGVGGKGGKSVEGTIFHSDVPSAAEEEDSDRPEWAGPPTDGDDGGKGRNDRGAKPDGAGTEKGDLYGDLYIILRDANGVPILNDGGFVQPIAYTVDGEMVVDEDGNPVLLALNEDGEVVDTTYVPAEVDLGRLNAGRSPSQVLSHSYDEAISTLSTATSVFVDASGRISYTTADGQTLTIDSPLENLALYVVLMEYGYLPTSFDGGDAITLSGDLAFLTNTTDGLSQDDLTLAASLFAAASDKAGDLNVDEIYYMNSILGINEDTTTDGSIDFSDFTYDRSTVWDTTVKVLKVTVNPDGTTTTEVLEGTLYSLVFDSDPYVSDDGGIDGFAQAADDTVQVIEFLHANTLISSSL